MNGLIHLADSQNEEIMNLRNEIDDLKRKIDDLNRENDELYDRNLYLHESKGYYKDKYLSGKPRNRGRDRRGRTRKWRESKNIVGSGDNENLFEKMSKYELNMTNNDRQIEHLKTQNRKIIDNLAFVVENQNGKIDDLKQEFKDLYARGCELRDELKCFKSITKNPCLDKLSNQSLENLNISTSGPPQCQDVGPDLEHKFPNLGHKSSSEWPSKDPHQQIMQTELDKDIQDTEVVHGIPPFLKIVCNNYQDIPRLENSNKLKQLEINRLQNILFDVAEKDLKQQMEDLLFRNLEEFRNFSP